MQTLTQKSSTTLTTGFAMFSMLFGAGNIAFAVSIGQYAQDKNFFAILGLLITAVGVPFLGLIAMTLFNGDYKSFFDRIGKVPGFLVAVVILGLIGPFGAIPRCIALSYSTIKMYMPEMSLPLFSLCACCFIAAFTMKRTSILQLVGYVLTPLKLGSLVFIIIKGLYYSPTAPVTAHTDLTVFLHGLQDGYQTMDLLGAFFLCSVVMDCLRKNMDISNPSNYKQLIKQALKSMCIGATLLGAIYIGFSYVAAGYSGVLANTSTAELISAIAIHVLGADAALMVCFTVTIACMTTAIALTTVFAEFIHKDLTNGKVSYPTGLIVTLLITYAVSTLDFHGIAQMLKPILQVCYPALITLSFMNILNKLYQFKPVKIPVFAVFILSCMLFYMN